MIQFSNKFKKILFLAHFPHFGGKRIFLKKSSPVTHNKTWAINTMLSFRKKLIHQSQENFRKDGRMDRPYFIGLFRLPPGIQKKSKNTNELTLRKMCYGKTDKLTQLNSCDPFSKLGSHYSPSFRFKRKTLWTLLIGNFMDPFISIIKDHSS